MNDPKDIIVPVGDLGQVRLSAQSYGDGITVHSVGGGLLYDGYIYSISVTLIPRNDTYYPQADCQVGRYGQTCTVPKKIRDKIVDALVLQLEQALTADPTILKRVKHTRWEQRVDAAQNQIKETEKSLKHYQDELESRQTTLKTLLRNEP